MTATNRGALLKAFDDYTIANDPNHSSLERPSRKAKGEYRVTMQTKVKNLTRWPLLNPQSFVKRGKLAHQPMVIPAGGLGQILMHKTDLSWFGCVGAISWDVKVDERENGNAHQVVAYYHSPWGRGPQGNWLGVGITEPSDIEILFKEMSSGTLARDYFVMRECAIEDKVLYPRREISVEGKMIDALHSTFELVLYPAMVENIAPNLRDLYGQNSAQPTCESMNVTG